jgi:hypothetical protein
MRVLRKSSIEEYADWYLQRERKKHPSCAIADEPRGSVEAMRRYHPGKMRDWFSRTTRWNIVLLDTLSDLQNLVFLESDWTKAEGLVIPDGANYRLLDRVAKNAIAGKYLTRTWANRHKTYYDEIARGSLRLEDNDRVAICTAEGSEVHFNPAARYYLLDGVGRCLPYMMLVAEHAREFTPIEAFLAER